MRSAGSGPRMQPPSTIANASHAVTYSRFRIAMLIGSSRAIRHEDVAFVAYRPDEPRMLGIGLDLLAQPHDAQVDAAIERIPVALLVEVQDPLARQRAIWVRGKRLQQVE